MLFPPRSLDGSPQLTLELDASGNGDLLPRILWAGVATPATAAPGGCPSTFRGPGVPLLGEHAHELFTRPHLIGHRVGAPGSDAAWSTRFVGRRGDGVRRPAGGPCHRRLGRARPGRRARGAPRWPAAGPPHHHQHRARQLSPRRARRRPAGSRRPGRAARLHRAARGRAHPATARRSPTGCGCARAARGGPASVAPPSPCSARPGSTPAPARCSGCTWRGAATAPSGSSDPPTSARPSAAASCCSPARWCSSRATTTRRPWVVFGASEEGLDGLAAAFHTYERVVARAPDPPAGRAQRVGGRLVRPRPPAAARDRRPRGPRRHRAVRAGRRLVPRSPRRHRRSR